MGESDFRAALRRLQGNFQARIRRIICEFRRPPGLNDAVVRLQFEGPARDVSIPGGELPSDTGGRFGGVSGHGTVSGTAQPRLVDLRRGGRDDGGDLESVFHLSQLSSLSDMELLALF